MQIHLGKRASSLHDRGMMVQEVVLRRAQAVQRKTIFRFRRSYAAANVEFIRDLSTLLGVGVPLLDALKTLSDQQTGGFRSVVLQLQDRVAAGSSLALGMREHPDIFDQLDVSVVDVGETAGTLDSVLNRLADFKENSAALRGRIGSALLYPAIVFVGGDQRKPSANDFCCTEVAWHFDRSGKTNSACHSDCKSSQ